MDFAGDALYRLVRFDDTYGFRLAIRLRVKRRVGLDGPASVSATLERACTLENVRSRWGWWSIRQSRRDDKGEAQACNCRLLHAANVRGHRADGKGDTTRSTASEAPGGPRCYASWAPSGRRTLVLDIGERPRKDEIR
jgi:hypothetical protein